MAAFYNQGDQAIYNSGQHFVPQEKYRLGYTAPVPSVEEQKITQTFGIPNTNAFTNSGGMGSNAFGYGSPVQEVNVRTFNPQSNDPTGSVANAQTMYNKASNAGPMVETFSGMRPSESVMDYYGGQIMNNREQYGAQGQYNSPYDDTIDLGFRGRDTSTSLEGSIGKDGKRKVSTLSKIMNNMPYLGAIKKGAKFLGGLMPDNPNGPGGGTYGIGGLSDEMKGAYNALAKGNMLFDGSSGMKTLTGKNFGAKGYMEGQRDIYDKEFADMTDEEIEALKNDPRQRFKYKQFQESSALFKDKIAAADKAYKEQQGKDAIEMAANTKNPDGSIAAYNYAGRDNAQGTHTSTQTNEQAQANQDRGRGGGSGGKEMMAKGGRAGYFFGGRVNFKNGGLASIL